MPIEIALSAKKVQSTGGHVPRASSAAMPPELQISRALCRWTQISFPSCNPTRACCKMLPITILRLFRLLVLLVAVCFPYNRFAICEFHDNTKLLLLGISWATPTNDTDSWCGVFWKSWNPMMDQFPFMLEDMEHTSSMMWTALSKQYRYKKKLETTRFTRY